MLMRLLKLLIIVAWIPLMLAIEVLGTFIILPMLAIAATVKWIFTGKSFFDWIIDGYLEFLYICIFTGVIDKIIEYTK